MNQALAGSGGEAFVKLQIAEALQGKRIMLLPVSEGGMNLKTTDINRLIETMGRSVHGSQKRRIQRSRKTAFLLPGRLFWTVAPGTFSPRLL